MKAGSRAAGDPILCGRVLCARVCDWARHGGGERRGLVKAAVWWWWHKDEAVAWVWSGRDDEVWRWSSVSSLQQWQGLQAATVGSSGGDSEVDLLR